MADKGEKPDFFELNDSEEEFIHGGTGGTVSEAHLENLDITFRRIIISDGSSEPREIWSYGGQLGDSGDKEADIERARKSYMGEDDGMEVIVIK